MPALRSVAAGLLVLLPFGSANAAESYDNCSAFIDALPAVISTQGVWCLRSDLATKFESGYAITVATNNVTIDCNDFKIGNLAASDANGAAAIYAIHRNNFTVRRCNLRGFGAGVYAAGSGAGVVVEDNRVDNARYYGLYISAATGTVRRNTIVDTISTLWATGIHAEGDLDIVDNTIDTVESGDAVFTYGIEVSFDRSASVRRNTIRNVLNPAPGATVAAIRMSSTLSDGLVDDNFVVAAPVDQASVTTGVLCAGGTVVARRNVVVGFDEDVFNCASYDNILR